MKNISGLPDLENMPLLIPSSRYEPSLTISSPYHLLLLAFLISYKTFKDLKKKTHRFSVLSN